MDADHSIRRHDNRGRSDHQGATLGQLMARDLASIFVSSTTLAQPQAHAARQRSRDPQGKLGTSLGRPSSPPPPPPPPPPGGGAAPALGGVDLAARSIQVDPKVEPIAAVVIDPHTGGVILVGETGAAARPAVDPSYFALGLYLALTKREAAMSLDPADPKNPRGKWLKAVYWPPELGSHRAGRAAFDADFLLKQSAFGVRIKDGKAIEWASQTGLKSLAALMREKAHSSAQPAWARMWIVAEKVELAGDGGAMRATARLGVRARRQVPDAGTRTGLRDVDTDPDSIEARFARDFTLLYPRLAVETPEFAIEGLVKAIALARWAVDQGATVDAQALAASLDRERISGVEKVTALDVAFRSEERTPQAGGGLLVTSRAIHVFGGVDLGVKPTSIRRAPEMRSLQRVVLQRLAAATTPEFTVEFGGRRLQATRLVYTGARQGPQSAAAVDAGRPRGGENALR
jgi:hypothetical protein